MLKEKCSIQISIEAIRAFKNTKCLESKMPLSKGLSHLILRICNYFQNYTESSSRWKEMAQKKTGGSE
jgi:hypothetical protein